MTLQNFELSRNLFNWDRLDYESKLLLSKLEYAKSCTESLKFRWCSFYGNFQDTILKVSYPNLKKLHLLDCKILDSCRFKQLPKLEELRVEQSILSKCVNDAKGEYEFIDLEARPSFKVLFIIIYNDVLKFPIIPPTIQLLLADVNFANEFQRSSNNIDILTGSIGAIPQCTL
ncbi:hypothetical protein FGO68_gene5302 [Halteria grandinella]|uniref:Uncharacterized protein n=1 Tax=Halteria grandinella TaxID=5974 RepID=A0A8J8SWV6_HALGN|nr:hypothetical protein FGO68_gene5302 [Halteria grandinella]